METNKENNNIKNEANTLQILNSLAVLRAREAGLIKSDTSNYEAGVLGSYMSDIQNITHKLEQQEMDIDHAKQAVKNASKVAIKAIVAKVYDKITIPIANYLSILNPTLGLVANAARVFMKHIITSKVAEKVVEFAGKAWNWLKRKVLG